MVDEEFAANGTGQPTHDIQTPAGRYVPSENTTFIVWQGNSLDPYATAYDHDTGSWSPNTKVGSNPLGSDDHGAPSINVTSDGTLHAFWGSHNDPTKYAQSDNAYDTSSWTTQSEIGSDTTYPIPLVNPNTDDIYVFIRERAGDYSTTGNVPETIYRSTDGGDSWTNIGPVIDFGGQAGGSSDVRIYVMGVAQSGTIAHLAWCWYDGSAGSRFNIYHAKFDMADDSLQAQDGQSLSSPIDKPAADSYCLAFDSGSEATNVPRVGLDGSNAPHILFQHDNSGTWEYRYLRWDGSNWTSPTTVTASGEGTSAGTLLVDTETQVTSYLPVGSDGDRGGDIETWVRDDTGWGKSGILRSESGDDLSNPRRVLPTRSSELEIVYSEIDIGDFSNSDLSVYAYGSTTAPGFADAALYASFDGSTWEQADGYLSDDGSTWTEAAGDLAQ